MRTPAVSASLLQTERAAARLLEAELRKAESLCTNATPHVTPIAALL